MGARSRPGVWAIGWTLLLTASALAPLVSSALAGSAGASPPTRAVSAIDAPLPFAAGRAILPGTSLLGETFLSAPAFALRDLGPDASPPHPPGPSVRDERGGGSPPMQPRIGGPTRNGSVTGLLIDQQTGSGIANASIDLALITGGCPYGLCPVGETGSNGSFNVSAPAGIYTITLLATGYAENQTQTTVTAAAVDRLGTIYLEEDAIVTGVLRGADPAREAVANISVTGGSRNTQVTGVPTTSASNGSFSVELPPGADRVDFVPPSGNDTLYLANHTFVDPAPGQTVDLGVVYLVRATQLNITLIDRLTTQDVGAKELSSGYTCEAWSDLCPLQPPTSASYLVLKGPHITLEAAPGPTVLHLASIGYAVNVTMIGNVPIEPAGRGYPVEVNVTPVGAVAFTANVTGGNPTAGGNLTNVPEAWFSGIGAGGGPSTNESGLAVCSLEGVGVGIWVHPIGGGPPYVAESLCEPGSVLGFGGRTLALAPPLRDEVLLEGYLGVVPLFYNLTWANVTPDRITPTYLNFTPGAYIAGSVHYVNGTQVSTGDFSAVACSTDEAGDCGPDASFPGGGLASIDAANATRVGCPTAAGSFCIPAPPGPVKVTVKGEQNGSALASGSNWTWAEVPSFCCTRTPHVLALANITTDHVASINLTLAAPEGIVTGRVVALPSQVSPQLTGFTVKVCPEPLATKPCTPPIFGNGSFDLPAPQGWDEVDITPSGSFAANATWVDVNGNTSAGTIFVAADAYFSGQVLSAEGGGVLGVSLELCPGTVAVDPESQCFQVPNTGASTSGYFVGQYTGSDFPGNVYLLTASASGYFSNFTWFNATPGTLSVIPPIVLTPVGTAGLPAHAAVPAAARPSGTVGAWVVGRVVDNATGQGIDGVVLQACTLSMTCYSFSDSTNTWGAFNDSLPLGTYYLSETATGYSGGSTFVNATTTATHDLGTIDLTPYPWVSGRVAIWPWVDYTLNAGFGPDLATAQACLQRSGPSVCGVSGVVDTSGRFNLSAPFGSDDLYLNGTGGPGSDLFTGSQFNGAGSTGYVGNVTLVTASGRFVPLGAQVSKLPVLAIFSALLGTLWDASSRQGVANLPTVPARFAWVAAQGKSADSSVSMPTGGGGAYTVLIPGNESVEVVGSGAAFDATNATVMSPGPGLNAAVPAIVMPHYGWVVSTIYNTTGARVPFAMVSLVGALPGNGTRVILNGQANGMAYVNLSAIPGSSDTIGVTAPGYGVENTTARVNQSRTTVFSVAGLPPNATIEFVRSTVVNTTRSPPTQTLRDPVADVPLAEVYLQLINGSGDVAAGDFSNGLGEFDLGVSPPTASSLLLSLPGYVPQKLPVPPPVNGTVVYGTINVTGDGVIAGRVIATPGNRSVGGVNVTACQIFPNGPCTNVNSNGAGLFWAEVAPGDYAINLSAYGYSTNASYATTLGSDQWEWIGNLSVITDATVTGTVVGEPFGLPIPGANVTLCPTDGSYSPYCSEATPTDRFGGFLLPSPPGDDFLNVTASGYGTYSIVIELAPGESFAFGTIGLSPDGSVLGEVVDAQTDAPIPNATVLACPKGSGPCAPPVTTSSAGAYAIRTIAPGAVVLAGSATGFEPGFEIIDVPSGGTADPGPLGLWPIGTPETYPVQGVVLWNGTAKPIPGATVEANGPTGGGSATVSAPNGSFALGLAPGHYRITASADGARPGSIDVAVGNASVAGLVLRLNATTYAIDGTVAVAGGTEPLAGVTVSAGPGRSTLSASDGSFALALPNGTYTLSANASAPSPLAGAVAAASVGIVVNGGDQRVALSMAELRVPVTLEAVNRLTGAPVAGANGTLRGTSELGLAVEATLQAGPNGVAPALLPAGNYTAEMNASGFSEGSVVFIVAATATGGAWAVDLSPLPASSAAALPPWVVPAAIAGAVVVTAIALVFLWRRKRARSVDAFLRADPNEPEPGAP
jgi:hypothetical protein